MSDQRHQQQLEQLFNGMELGDTRSRPSSSSSRRSGADRSANRSDERNDSPTDTEAPAARPDARPSMEQPESETPSAFAIMLAGNRAPRPRPLQFSHVLRRDRRLDAAASAVNEHHQTPAGDHGNGSNAEPTEELDDDIILPYMDPSQPRTPWSPHTPRTPWSPQPPRGPMPPLSYMSAMPTMPHTPMTPATPLPGYGSRTPADSTDVSGESTPHKVSFSKDDYKAPDEIKRASLRLSPGKASRLSKYRELVGEKPDDKFTVYKKVRQASSASEVVDVEPKSPMDGVFVVPASPRSSRFKLPKLPKMPALPKLRIGPLPEMPALELGLLSRINPFLSSKKRERHLDGLRLLAAVLVLSSTVVGSVPSDSKLSRTLLYPIRSDFGLILFFVLCGRTVGLPWIKPRALPPRSPPPPVLDAKAGKKGEKRHDQDKEQDPKQEQGGEQEQRYEAPPVIPAKVHYSTEPMFQTMGKSIVSRPFRFLLPALIVSAIQYRLCKTTNMSASHADFHAVFSRPFATDWCLENAVDWLTTFVNLFTMETMSQVLRQQTSMLFTVPWLLQGSYYAYVMAMFGEMLGKDTRLFFYFAIGALNWASWSYLSPFVAGIFLAELDVSGRFARLLRPVGGPETKVPAFFRALASSNVLGFYAQLVSAAGMGLMLFLPSVRDNTTEALSQLHTLNPPFSKDFWSGYDMVRFADLAAAFFLVALVDMTPVLRYVFNLRPISLLGQHLSAGITVMHPIVFWNIVPRLVSMPSEADRAMGKGTSSTVATVWIVCLAISTALAVLFRLLLEYPSSLLGELFVALWFGKGKYLLNPSSVNRSSPR
ncbi:uncharacterized protein PFL1_01770 [Pseudozyma flocculosa PF-1]|uniref:Uncharacterized protein n=1 Tax=Pseudozyma flocculosa TaxID=84751 RepID=A0A5C3EWV6_9BASI|nr:uncharacterized protein PFL1_01770 [Pseudozyma flocculosa PF-1]EPQ30873.1 hypothetical protein PFL1_01770 [Pseudozyma flocculosa PF-1]SPO36753.1 uncharacterized protein PSFLO_02224 [Pseudozyma flocculosa]